MRPLLLMLAVPLLAEQVKCPVSADTWIEMHRWEAPRGRSAAAAPHGSDKQLVVKGRDAFALLQFDLSAAKGLTVSRAVLRIRRKPDPIPVHTMGLSTISGIGPWNEASANFFGPNGTAPAWAYPGSDLIDVTFAQGGSLYSYPRARDAGDGWWEMDVPPVMVHALITGDQYGLMLTDEKGQTQTRHSFASRESGSPAELMVEGERRNPAAPGPLRADRAEPRAPLHAGSVTLAFAGAGIAQGYDLRFSRAPITAANFEQASKVPRWSIDPLAPKAAWTDTSNRLHDRARAVVEGLEPGQTYHFAARAFNEAGITGPVSALGSFRAHVAPSPSLPARSAAAGKSAAPSGDVKIWAVPELLKIDAKSGALLEQAAFPEHRAANTVWNADRSTVTLTGARNEFVAFQLAVESAGPLRGVSVRVSKPLFAKSRLPEVFRSTGAIQLYREWFVPDGKGWYPDALVPLSAPFDVPAADNAVPGQTVQPLFADVYIPHDAPAGRHAGELTVSAAGRDRVIRIEVDVLPFALPDKLNFVIELNGYSGVGRGTPGLEYGTPAYRELEHAYQRVAHLHRSNLDILGYSHAGTTVPDHAPPLTGEGAQTRIADWSAWDAHFGPLVSGTAFADLPRSRIPVYAIYLPFFENWPGEMKKHYRFNDYPIAKTSEEYLSIMASHGMKAAPVEEAFTSEYQDRFQAVIGDFAAHLEQRGWTKSQYFVYLNNKYYYRRPEQGGRGVSWWLLDEPNHRDDVRAISFFANLTKQGLRSHPNVPILFRTDISRVEWIRDMLVDQIDLNCISQQFFNKNRYLNNDRRRFGKTLWNYASTNHPRDTNVAMRAWCWRVWVQGGDAVLPWNTLATARAWEQAEPLTVFYPAHKFGQKEPFASMRLKAYRRGQQDMEYLVLLAQRKGWDRDSVSRAVTKALDLSGDVTQTDEEDAGQIRFKKVQDHQLDDLRLRVAKALAGGTK